MRGRTSGWLRVGLAAVVLVGLGACGDDDDAVAPATSATDQAADGALADGAPADGVPFETVVLADGTELEYALLLPDGFEPDGSTPVLLALPPGGQDHDVVEGTVEGIYAEQTRERGWAVVSPVAPDGTLFFQGSEQYLPELMDRLEAGLVPEGGRFYLSGISNGGRSAFRIATLEPERFAGLIVFPGYPGDEDQDRLASLVDLPIRMYVGGEDGGWVEASQAAFDALTGLGADVELTVVPGEPHIISTLSDGVTVFDQLDALRAGS